MAAEIRLYKSTLINDGPGNGGALSNNPIIHNAAENVFPHVPESERTAGKIRCRKAFIKKESGVLTAAKFMMDRLSTAGDYFRLKKGTDCDVQATVLDYGWTESNITWTLANRAIALSNPHSLAKGDEVWFFSSTGVYRGRANITNDTSSSTIFTIDMMTDGSNPATGDNAITFWKGAGELNEPLTGGSSKVIVAGFEAPNGIFSKSRIALIDWDNPSGGLPAIEYLDQTFAVWTIGAGGIVDERCGDISSWTDNESGGDSIQSTYDGRDTFKLIVAAAGLGCKAERIRNVGVISDTFTMEIRSYFDSIGTSANDDYLYLEVDNGAIKLKVRFTSTGLYVYDGLAWNQVGSGIVDQDVWTVWRFSVDASTPTSAICDVHKNGFKANTSTVVCSDMGVNQDGLVVVSQHGGTTNGVVSYIDFLKISDGIAVNSGECFIQCDTPCVSNHAVKTRGLVIGTSEENFNVDGLTLVVKINGGTSQTVMLMGNSQTAAQVSDQINAVLVGGTAYVFETTRVAIRSNTYYAENSVQVLSLSSVATELGLDTSIHYGTDGTVVACTLDLGTIVSSHTTPIKNSPAGTWDESGHPILTYDVGTVTDVFTVTFSSASVFSVAGVLSGNVGSGITGVDFQPAHWGSYFFKIPAAGWGGTWAIGDTLAFGTANSAKGVWFKEVIPSGTLAHGGNSVSFTLDGETA
jgi:hypothetical protein